MLSFAKGYAPVKTSVSTSDLVENAVNFFLRGSNVVYERNFEDTLWVIEVDEGQMSQVII